MQHLLNCFIEAVLKSDLLVIHNLFANLNFNSPNLLFTLVTRCYAPHPCSVGSGPRGGQLMGRAANHEEDKTTSSYCESPWLLQRDFK